MTKKKTVFFVVSFIHVIIERQLIAIIECFDGSYYLFKYNLIGHITSRSNLS